MAVQPRAVVTGTVRSAELQTKRDTGEVYGTRLTILTEPAGGFLEVLAFESLIAPPAAEALVGTTVTAQVDLGVSVTSRGAGFLNARLVKLDDAA